VVHEIDVLPWQMEFLACQDDIAAVIGGFASGKSFIAANWFTDRCMQFPEANHIVVCKDLPQAKKGPLSTLRGVLDSRDIEYHYNASTGQINFDNGCRVAVKAVQNYLAFRSLEADTLWCDETADWGPSAELAFVRYVQPRLRYSPKGKQYIKYGMRPQMRITTNPSPINSWLYKLIVERQFCKYWNVSLRTNYLMPDLEGYIDRQERSMSPDLWPFLIDGNWGSTTAGQVYKGFSRAACCITPPPGLPAFGLDMTKPLLWAHDFNVGMMCSTISQLHQQNRIIIERRSKNSLWNLPGASRIQTLKDTTKLMVEGFQHGVLYIMDEIRIPNAGTPDVCEEFGKRYINTGIAQRTGVILYGDPAGGGRSQQLSARQAARSNWAIIVQYLQSKGVRVEFRVMEAAPSVLDRVNEVKAQILTKDGKGLIIDPDKCPHTVKDFEAVTFKEGTNDILKDDKEITHLTDATGYMIYVERTLQKRKVVEFRKTLE